MALAIAAEMAVSRSNSIVARQIAACASCAFRARNLCGEIPDSAPHRLATTITRLHIAAGDAVFEEGEAAEHVMEITSGTVEIYKVLPDGRRQIIGFLFPGDVAGLAVGDSYVYSAGAVTEVNLCRFPRHQLRSLIEAFPAMEKRLLRMTVSELASAQDQMVLLGRKTASEKLASFLLMLFDRGSKPGTAEIHVPMTREAIADYLGLTTETVSRTFTQLRKRGWIKLLEPGSVRILHRDQMEDLAAGVA